MVRLVLGGEGVERVEALTPDEHVKIVFADADGTVRPPRPAATGDGVEWPRPFPPTREYTIRRNDGQEIWVDFVVHPGGLASDWAQVVAPGATVWLAGPRPGESVGPEFTHHVLLADHTALPAVARWLEELPAHVTAHVAVALGHAEDRQELVQRDGIDVTWLLPGDDELGEHLAGLAMPAGRAVYLWAAGEAGVLKPIRRWARANGFARGSCDIAGYWRRARTATLPH